MIEVEVRGKLSEDEYSRLREFLSLNGTLQKKNRREMYLLFDNPGFTMDPTKREVDIRLRNTDGFCEIMVKHKLSDGNHARRETSLELKDTDLETAKQVVKALGCARGLKMVREKEVYECDGVEWALVNCPPKNLKYYEAEKAVPAGTTPEAIHAELMQLSERMGFPALDDEGMKEFLYWLDEQVNEEVNF